MIDTGGTCAFLSDPDGYVYAARWPDPVANPDWAKHSVLCQSTSDDITLELGDSRNSFSYRLDTSHMPPAVQGLTLVLCKQNEFMRGQYGLNIGGISALAIAVLVDYKSARVGLKPK